MRSAPAWTRRSSRPVWCTISASSASFAPITTIGAPRWWAPYVEEEVAWAIRAHKALRFYPDESVGYSYPESYIKNFGADYRPDPYIEAEYRCARDHKWYMTARMITVHDIYSFDPEVVVHLEEFTDIIGRNFRQPKEGL